MSGSFLGGHTVDRIGLKTVTLVGGILIASGIILYMSVDNYLLFIAGFIVSGLGGGIFEIGINAVVPAVSKTVADQTRYFNWLHGFYGIGATGLPILSVWILQNATDWRSGFWFELAMLGLILLFVLFFRYDDVTKHRNSGTVQPKKLAKSLYNPLLFGFLAAIMSYVMAEVGFATWLPTYLVQVKKLTLAEGAIYLAGFYFTFTLGRVTGHWWINRIGQVKTVMICICTAIISLAIAIYGSQGTALFFVVAGVGFSAIFPTIAAIACDIYADHAGKVLGLLFTASGIGAMLANWLIGSIAASFGLHLGFSLIVLFLLAVLICMLGVMRLQKEKQRSYPENQASS